MYGFNVYLIGNGTDECELIGGAHALDPERLNETEGLALGLAQKETARYGVPVRVMSDGRIR